MVISIAANALIQPCGCRTWDQWQDGEWVHRSCNCYRHADWNR